MDTIMDSFGSEKLFPSANLLDLEDLNEGDFLNNVPFSEQMEDFSSVLFSSFFDEGLLAERGPLLAIDMDQPPSPDIQAEHSYSFSGDSAPQSPSMSIKMDEDEEFEGMWNFSQDLTAILVKQEPGGHGPEPHPAGPAAQPLTLAPPPHRSTPQDPSCRDAGASAVPTIKAEPGENNQFLNVPTDDQLQLPPTPPSSHGSDSDGSQSPHSLPPSSPSRLQARSSAAISTSPLLTAPHKLQGTSGPLMLTEEEKRTLVAEGYPVPNKLPLTKTEEKALKRVRRKIKNKISAQESRRKKKEYVECLEKKVENYNSENTDLWKKVETLESANRSLLQQLQKLQSLVTGKIPRSSKMASTQTSTCLMVVVLCFFLVLGSLVPCLPELSSLSHTVKSTSSPPPSTDLYTTSQVRSRSLLFHDESSQMEDSPRSVLKMEAEGWEGPGPSLTVHHTHHHAQQPHNHGQQPHDHGQQPQTSRYRAQAHSDSRDLNGTSGPFHQEEPRFHKRDLNPDGAESF